MFKIGLYEREITPFLGNSLDGYFNVRLADGVKDKTYAKAVVIEKNGETVAMLAIDACSVSDELIDAVYARVKKYLNIKRSNVLICATHSHTGGPTTEDTDGADKKLDGLYLDFLACAGADTIICAYQRLQPAHIKLTVAKIEGTTFCRNYLLKNGVVRTNPGVRNPDIVKPFGEVDVDAPVLLFESEKGEKLGMAYSFGNHQDSVDGTEISGDWSSVVSYRMKEKFGTNFISVMFYGTAGNVNQVDVNSKDKDVSYFLSCYKDLGNAAADAIEKALLNVEELSGDISVVFDTKVYENRVPNKEEIEEQDRIFHSVELPEGAKLDASSPKELFDACSAQRCLEFTFAATKYYQVKMQVIKLGKVLIFALPGEVFTQFGKKIKEAFPENVCFFACLANNKWTYMPAKDCYLPELYESLYGSAHFYPEDVEDIFDTIIELGKKL